MDLVKNMWPAEATWNVKWEKIRKLDLADSFQVSRAKRREAMINSFYKMLCSVISSKYRIHLIITIHLVDMPVFSLA